MAHAPVVSELTRLGGCATRAQLLHVASGRRIRRAVGAGAVVRVRRGRYALPFVDEHRRVAHHLTAVLSHLSAAVAHGWGVKTAPTSPWVTVRRHRRLSLQDREGVVVVWCDLEAAEIAAGVTSPVRTVLECARRLPFDEALAVADSALRAQDVTSGELRTAADALRGPGAPQARRVARHASGLAANPFESVLRAIVLDLFDGSGVKVTPQLPVWDHGLWARVDLGVERLHLALEAEGFAAHSSRSDLVRDCHRYTELAVWGWTVLRFSWEDVMLHPEYVRWAILGWLARREGRPVSAPPRRSAS